MFNYILSCIIFGTKVGIPTEKKEFVKPKNVKVNSQRAKHNFVKSVFERIAKLFEMVAAIEKHHEERYRKLLDNVTNEKVFSKDGDVIWQCSNCGHIVVGKKAPGACPVCAHPKSFFQVEATNY